MSEKPPTLVFDLDGTLVDTARDLTGALNAVLSAEGMQPVRHEDALGMVGQGARAMLAAGAVHNGTPLDEDTLDRLMARFIDHYDAHIADHARPYPGAVQALDRFAAEGWRLAVCTNKLEGLSKSLLTRLGLADRFAFIAGQDTFSVRKPDPGHVVETIRAAGGDPGRAVMVGDSEIDVGAAKAAGVPVIAVTFGYSQKPVAELGADVLIDHYDALYDEVSSLMARAE
ncbi:phosphoglycolate phosphatase [Bauldia sp.]|uniref:phosphoglycolate phosphatase n=1 Tax=Bauldia sp. TaxID=2575872 RepID=UPI003BAA6499